MIKKVIEDYKVLLRSIPAATVSLFFVSVIMMNLLANKELISLPYLALDCGFVVSWVSFLCQDMICKRFGAKASIKISILALAVNLAVSLCFWACSLTPGMWGAYYDTGMIEVNTALNATIGGTWYVVLGSSLAMLVSAVVNSTLNQSLGTQKGDALEQLVRSVTYRLRRIAQPSCYVAVAGRGVHGAPLRQMLCLHLL